MPVALRDFGNAGRSGRIVPRVLSRGPKSGVTLIELLTVVAIITLLIAMLMPALNAAREAARGSACQSNLRQFGVGLQSHAARQKQFCSGAFDWTLDGCVTEYGWVADLVNNEIPVGTMLCPSNPAKIARTYNDLLRLNSPDPCSCIDVNDEFVGTAPETLPDGSEAVQPCWKIVKESIPAYATMGDARHTLVSEQLYDEHYNTNYTASWFLVRGGPKLDGSGNLPASPGGTPSNPAYLKTRCATLGPMTLDSVDAAALGSTFIPMLGCGGTVPGESLAAPIGDQPQSAPVTQTITGGPILREAATGASVVTGIALQYPTFNAGAPRDGAVGAGWWATWGVCLQDYRQFAPVHRGACNILFADGSVRSFLDDDEDGLLNNGFAVNVGGFKSDKIELPREEVASGWSLKEKAR